MSAGMWPCLCVINYGPKSSRPNYRHDNEKNEYVTANTDSWTRQRGGDITRWGRGEMQKRDVSIRAKCRIDKPDDEFTRNFGPAAEGLP